MIELMLGALVVSGMLCVVPQAVADVVATVRASAAGQWDLIDKQRQRRQERWAKAWGAVRAARNRRAGGNGNYRPGASAYLGDLYHGFWEDKLEKRGVKRAARPPYEYDPDAPKWHERVDAAVLDKVGRLRNASGRVGRALVDPVGERRQPADVARSVPPVQPSPLDVDLEPQVGDVVDAGRRTQDAKQRVAREMPQGPAVSVVHDSDEYVIKPESITAEEINANLQRLAPVCHECGTRMTVPKYDGPGLTVGILESYVSDPYTCPNCGAQTGMKFDHFTGANWVIGRRSASEARTTGINSTSQGDTMTTAEEQTFVRAHQDYERNPTEGRRSDFVRAGVALQMQRHEDTTAKGTAAAIQEQINGGTTMGTTATSDAVHYDQAVADHEQALARLRGQLDRASALAAHLTAASSAVEGMDQERHEVATATTVLAEGLEQGRYGAGALEGAATTAEVLTAGKVAETEEWIEAAEKQNQEWIAGLEVSIAGVEASLADIQSRYGEASAVVQETGVDGRVLEAE